MRQPNGETLLAVERVTKRFKNVLALDDVSFTITDGITGILGENGAGKSTIIKILLGLLPPTSGSAKVLGRSAFENVAVRARVGSARARCLPSELSAAEFCQHGEVSGIPRTRAHACCRTCATWACSRTLCAMRYSTG